MIDKFNRYECDEDTGIELLYKGKSLAHVEFTETDDIKLYNEKCTEFDFESLKILTENDFDRINTYLIPEHYKNLDSAGFNTTVQPAASAGPSLRVSMEIG